MSGCDDGVARDATFCRFKASLEPAVNLGVRQNASSWAGAQRRSPPISEDSEYSEKGFRPRNPRPYGRVASIFGLQLDSKRWLWEGLRRVTLRSVWSGRRDLNPGPLAPQARNISYLQAAFAENTRLSATGFGRQMDAKGGNRAVWTPRDSTICPPSRAVAQQRLWFAGGDYTRNFPYPIRMMPRSRAPADLVWTQIRCDGLGFMTCRNLAREPVSVRWPQLPVCVTPRVATSRSQMSDTPGNETNANLLDSGQLPLTAA